MLAGRGEIVAIYHDVDVSRSLTWKRRPQAAALLADLRSTDRAWDAVAIGEVARAFGNVEHLRGIARRLHRHGVAIWAWDLGGPYNPADVGSRITGTIRAELAQEEVDRLRGRVIDSMEAQARSGRWLGGRAPYGYRVVDTDEPHPNPAKAALGIKLRRLEPDPRTAPVVQRIFTLYLDGHGYKHIARVLTDEGMMSPSAVDPTRNRHRPQHAWAASAVRAILENPRYTGVQVFGRARKTMVPVDEEADIIDDVKRQLRQPATTWVYSDEESHAQLIAPEVFERAQAQMRTRGRGNGGGSPRSDAGRYVLRGLLWCGHCQRRMQGTHLRGQALYRCRATSPDYATVPAGHPRSLAVQERRLLAALDPWLTGLFADDKLEEAARMVADADRQRHGNDPRVAQARQAAASARLRIERLLDAVERGGDSAVYAPPIERANRDLAAAQLVLDAMPPAPEALTDEEIMHTLRALGDMPSRLAVADGSIRADVYESLGIQLTYRRDDDGLEQIRISASIDCVDLERVGGASSTRGTRAPWRGVYVAA